MSIHVALVADFTCRYAHVWGEAPSWGKFLDQLEDVGCEVIEEQTEVWEDSTQDEIAEDCLSIHQLLNDTDFVPHE